MMKNSKNDNSKINKTTGHEWDGIEEYDQKEPSWWWFIWIVSIIWAIILCIFYPSIPFKKESGLLGWSQKKELKESTEEIRILKKDKLTLLSNLSFDEIKKDPILLEFALAGGKITFQENCAACHGIDASGTIGFPNLNDDDWLWGGKIDDVYKTIKYGIRSDHQETRFSQMPSFGEEGILSKKEIEKVYYYILSLNSPKKLLEAKAGEEIFVTHCAVCHGKDAKGNKELGSPNLTDAIWLYGNKKKDIMNNIHKAKNSVMPAWENRFSDNVIKQLSIYVHSLGGVE